MKRVPGKIYNYFLLKIRSLTIRQANIFTTLFIFAFSVIFAYLLIVENYHDYERELLKEKYNYEHYSQLDEETVHKQNQEKLKTLLIKNTLAIATLAFILFAIMLGIYKIFNTLLQRDTDAFLEFFQKAAYNDQVLNPNTIFFKDFKTMVQYANRMMETISEQKKSLQELNSQLEERVKKKTANLVHMNEDLLKQTEFSNRILKAQKEFLRYTVHETNTPLSVILTSIEILAMKSEKSNHLSKIEAAAKNIVNIYDDLSYLVKKDQIEYPKVPVKLDLFIQSRIDFFADVASHAKVSFEYISHAKESYIYFNETKLQRVIDNNITNAIKYTIPKEQVDIGLEVVGSYLEFSIGSRSKEIKHKEKIFEAYYREENSQEGFGIGLKLVQAICEEEGVEIALSSQDGYNRFSYKFKVMGA